MSFILDALKKAEAERQRQSGPTLLELRVTAPRRRWPVWSVLIGILLVANIIVVLGTALRPRPAPATVAAASAPLPSAAVASSAAAPPALATVPTVLTTVPPAAASAVPAAPPPAAAAVEGSGAAAAFESAAAAAAADEVAEEAGAPSTRASGSNPADDAPAVTAPVRHARAPLPAAPSKSEAELPSLSELGGSVPALRLDLHVYAERPADRYALINMHRAQEGDMLPEGVRVVQIDRDGVELSYRGTEFMLRPQ